MSNLRPSDLRIGNIVRNASGPFRVGINTLLAMSSPNVVVEGEPLTEEWLRLAGFVKCSCGGWKIDGVFHIERNMTVKGSFGKSVMLKSIHQLQNLYQALTGTELTFPTLHEDADIND